MGATKGVPQLQARLSAVADPKTDRAILGSWQTKTVGYAKILAPHRSAHLEMSIHKGELTEKRATVEASAPYAAAQELGSGLHGPNHSYYIIKPVKGKWLAWGGARRLTGSLRKGAKADHFAKVVHHPGVKPHPYLAPASERALKEVGVGTIVTAWNSAA